MKQMHVIHNNPGIYQNMLNKQTAPAPNKNIAIHTLVLLGTLSDVNTNGT